MLGDKPFFFARTVYCVALASLLFLLAAEETTYCSGRRCLLVALAGVLVVGVSLLSLNKGIAVLSAGMTGWIILVYLARNKLVGRMSLILCALLTVFVAAGIFVGVEGVNFELLHRMDTLERSVTVRLALWSLGLDAFVQHFPWALSLGQYWEVVVTDVTLAREGHLFVHNSFIAFMAEMGVLGLVFSAGLIGFLIYASRGWESAYRPIFFLLVLTPLTIHDGHSIRMLVVVAALGFANSVRDRGTFRAS